MQASALPAPAGRGGFSLAEGYGAVRERLDALNDKPFTKLDVSRRQLFEQADEPPLMLLPAKRFEVTGRKPNATVHIKYHVEYDRCYGSVPHTMRRRAGLFVGAGLTDPPVCSGGLRRVCGTLAGGASWH